MSSNAHTAMTRPSSSSRTRAAGSPAKRLLGALAAPMLVAAGVLVVSGVAAASGPSITVSQATGLADGQSVTVTGTGYTPSGDPVWIGECAAFTNPAVCDHEPAHQVFEPVDPNGGFSRAITVHETFQGATDANPGVPISVDCKVAPGCIISGGQSNPSISAQQSISFGAPQPSAAVTVTPSSGLSGGQQVTVNGSGWVPGHTIALFQCHNSQLPSGSAPCGNFQPGATADVNGAFQAPFTVQQHFPAVNDNNNVYDCFAAPGCSVIAGDNATSTYRNAQLSFGSTANQSITVTPSSSLIDGQHVTATGSGWVPGHAISLFQCHSSVAANGQSPCGNFQQSAIADVNGVFQVPFTVQQQLVAVNDNNTVYDCAVAPGCSVIAGDNATSTYRNAHLSFGAGGGTPVVTVTPHSGLSDGQQVSVSGSGYAPNQSVSVFECTQLPGNPPPCDFAHGISVLTDGTGHFGPSSVTVSRFITSGQQYDCVAVGCSLVAAQGPSTFAAQQLSFGAAPLTPTITVTPAAGLGGDQQVMVTGSGYAPNQSVAVLECANGLIPGSNPPQSPCDGLGMLFPVTDGSGNFGPVLLGVHRQLTASNNNNQQYDCVVVGCIVVGAQGNPPQQIYAVQALTFNPNGVSNAVENGAPNNGDGNGDGIQDSTQDNVASLPSAVTGGYLTIAAPNGTTLTGVSAASAPSTPPLPAGASLPLGLLSFDVAGVAHGATVDLVVYFPAGTSANAYLKLHNGSWVDFTSHATFSGNTVTLHVTDGGAGDADGSANGVIVDPGAVALTDRAAPAVTLTTPPEGAIYAQGSVVKAAYSCADNAGGSGLASCVGTVANNAAIDTATTGAHTFVVTGKDNATNSASVTHHYTVLKVAATKDDCKSDSWKSVVDSSFRPFKNQGDCVSFVATGGKNKAGG